MKILVLSLMLSPLVLTGCVDVGAGVGPDGAGAGVDVHAYYAPQPAKPIDPGVSPSGELASRPTNPGAQLAQE